MFGLTNFPHEVSGKVMFLSRIQDPLLFLNSTNHHKMAVGGYLDTPDSLYSLQSYHSVLTL